MSKIDSNTFANMVGLNPRDSFAVKKMYGSVKKTVEEWDIVLKNDFAYSIPLTLNPVTKEVKENSEHNPVSDSEDKNESNNSQKYITNLKKKTNDKK